MAPIVITNDDFRFLVAEQARELGVALSAILLKPVARNTASTVAAASVFVTRSFGEDAILQVLASDHEILTDAAYFDPVSSCWGPPPFLKNLYFRP